jgi:hypothetical protein
MPEMNPAPAAPEAPVRPVPTVEGNPVVPPPAAKAEAPKDAPKTEAKPEAAPDTPEGEDQQPKKRDFKQRFNEVYGKWKTADAGWAAATEKAARYKAEIERLRAAPTDQMTFEEQETARLRSTIKEESLEQANAEAVQHAKHRQEAQRELFREKIEAVRERIPDIYEAFAASPVEVSDVAVEFLADSDRGAELAYWLAKNPVRAREIMNLPPHRQGVELARQEARLAAAPQARKISQAPAPVPTIGGSAAPVEKAPSEMSMSEYMAWRKAGNG